MICYTDSMTNATSLRQIVTNSDKEETLNYIHVQVTILPENHQRVADITKFYYYHPPEFRALLLITTRTYMIIANIT